MSTAEQSTLALEPDHADPYFYGWREVRENGVLVNVPLTREDMLHPQEGDHVTVNDPHVQLCIDLYVIIRGVLKDIPGAWVFHDMSVFWDVPGMKSNGPDFTVVLNRRKSDSPSSFDVAEEGVRPALLIEVTSPSTCSGDLVEKVQMYAQAGVPFYAIIDIVPRRNVTIPRLIGYRLVDGEYEHVNPDEFDRLWLESLQIWLRIVDGDVVCEDARGQRLLGHEELRDELEGVQADLQETQSDLRETRSARDAALNQLAEIQAQRAAEAATAEQRIRELEEKLRQQQDPK